MHWTGLEPRHTPQNARASDATARYLMSVSRDECRPASPHTATTTTTGMRTQPEADNCHEPFWGWPRADVGALSVWEQVGVGFVCTRPCMVMPMDISPLTSLFRSSNICCNLATSSASVVPGKRPRSCLIPAMASLGYLVAITHDSPLGVPLSLGFAHRGSCKAKCGWQAT